LAIALFYAGSGLLLFTLSYLNFRRYRRWVASIESEGWGPDARKAVVVHPDLNYRMLALNAIPYLIGVPLLAMFFYIYLSRDYGGDAYDMSGLASIFIAFYLFFVVIVAWQLRSQTLVVTEGGIERVHLGWKGFKITASIHWAEVTKVSLYSFNTSGLRIEGGRKKLVVPDTEENLEPLFEIIRRRVKQSVIEDEAGSYIANPATAAWPDKAPRASDRSLRLVYSRFAKAFSICLIAAFFLLILISYIYSPRTPGILDIYPLAGLLLMGLLFSLYPLAVFTTYYQLSDEGIEMRGMTGKRTFIPWAEVESIIFIVSRNSMRYEVRGPGKKIVLNDGLADISSFCRMVVTHVPPDKWAKAKKHIVNMLKD
jgi:hypothetical protein